MKTKPIIFSGSAHPAFAKNLATLLKARLGRSDIRKFPNGELRLRILDEVRGQTVIVVQSLHNPSELHLVEFALLVDAVKQSSCSKIIGVVPWLAYSLQDEQFLPGEPVSVKLIASWIDCLKLSVLLLLDVHSNKGVSYFKTPIRNVTHAEIFGQHVMTRSTNQTVIVAPDQGAVKRAQSIASEVKSEVLVLEKSRDRFSGAIHYQSGTPDVRGKDCIICDDVVITGDTLVESATILKENDASSVVVYCTHALFSQGSTQAISESPIENLIVSDTIPIQKEFWFEKLEIVSAIPATAKALRPLLKEGTARKQNS